jgi:cobalt-zinc-cadmium efflux system protein
MREKGHTHEVRYDVAFIAGVVEVHDLHIRGMSTTEAALTAHLVKPDPTTDDKLTDRITKDLHTRFRIGHSTIQWERTLSRNTHAQHRG